MILFCIFFLIVRAFEMNNRSIIRAPYIQYYLTLIMKSINKRKDQTYDYSGLFIDDEEL